MIAMTVNSLRSFSAMGYRSFIAQNIKSCFRIIILYPIIIADDRNDDC